MGQGAQLGDRLLFEILGLFLLTPVNGLIGSRWAEINSRGHDTFSFVSNRLIFKFQKFRRLFYWRRKWRRDFFIFNASDSFLVVAFRLYFTWIDQERNADLAAPTGHRGRWESPFRNKRHRWKLDQSYSPSSNHPFPSWKADSLVLLGKWSNFNPKIPWSPLQGNDFTCQVCSSDNPRWTHHPIVSDPKGCS